MRPSGQLNPEAWLTSSPILVLPVPTNIVVGDRLLVQVPTLSVVRGQTLLLRYGYLDTSDFAAVGGLDIVEVHHATHADFQYLWLKLGSGDFCGLTLPDLVPLLTDSFWYLQIAVQLGCCWVVRTLQIDPAGDVLFDSGPKYVGALDSFYGAGGSSACH